MNTLAKAALKALFYPFFRRYVSMPGRSFKGKGRDLTGDEVALQSALVRHVEAFSIKIGVRHHQLGNSLSQSANYIAESFAEYGFIPWLQPFTFAGVTMHNVGVTIPGGKYPGKVVVVGAHYDTLLSTLGADDNATGVAALLELARLLQNSRPDCTICLVAYANEEDNGGAWESMGSFAHARELKESGADVIGMIALEMLGYFDDSEGSQKYPFPFNLFYPTKGNFIAFVGNSKSAAFVRQCLADFRQVANVASEGVAAPERFSDIARSDHWSYWQHGWNALMVTDTSNFRNPHLHTMKDTAETLNFVSMTRVVKGLEVLVAKLAGVNRTA